MFCHRKVRINLRIIYPEIYKKDCYMWVPDRIAELLHAFELEKEAERKRREYHGLRFCYVDMDSMMEPEDNMHSALEHILEREKNLWLCKAISKLPAAQQRRVVAFYFMGLSQTEIAKCESISQYAVSYSLKQAIRHLKNNL